MGHPVTKRLKSVRCQLLPNDRNVTIKKGSSDLVQLAAHPHLTSQGLQHTGESKQIPIGAKHKYTTPADQFTEHLGSSAPPSHPLQLSQRELHADHQFVKAL